MEDTQITQALEAGTALAQHQKLTPDGTFAPLLVVPDNWKAKVPALREMEAWFLAPLRKNGSFNFADVDSFVRYFNEHKNEESRIFSSISDSGGSFSAILNFHGAKPSFNDHSCRCTLVPTSEWSVWIQNNGMEMTQTEFAEFLEENQDMFSDPSGADLLELIQNLEAKATVDIVSGVRLQNGTIQLSYKEDVEVRGGGTTKQTGTLDVPALLNVSIAPFEGTSPHTFKARLRYKIQDRKLVFFYKTIDAHLVIRAVMAELTQFITSQTGLDPFKS